MEEFRSFGFFSLMVLGLLSRLHLLDCIFLGRSASHALLWSAFPHSVPRARGRVSLLCEALACLAAISFRLMFTWASPVS